jgi:hypothetical protein
MLSTLMVQDICDQVALVVLGAQREERSPSTKLIGIHIRLFLHQASCLQSTPHSELVAVIVTFCFKRCRECSHRSAGREDRTDGRYRECCQASQRSTTSCGDSAYSLSGLDLPTLSLYIVPAAYHADLLRRNAAM